MHDLHNGRILLTGGAGLIGSTVLWALNRRGLDDVLVVDRLDESEKWKHLVPLRFADYLDADDLTETLECDPEALGPIGTVIHLGACSSTTECDADFLMRNNYEYTKRLARWAIEREIRFVYASSAATYGSLESTLDDEAPLTDLRPMNAYAYSKHLFDCYASRQGWLEQICGIKYFNIFGPNEDHKGEMRSVVAKACEQIRESGTIRLFKSDRPEYADGEQRRDFLYVKDAVAMTLHLAASGRNGLFNVGAGKAQTWLDLVRPIFRALDVPERIEFVPMPEHLRAKYQYFTCARIDRLRDAGYTAEIPPLADAVGDYVRNYLLPGRVLEPHDAPYARNATTIA
ncbi:MAG: ADP-glyceromanno-heptose 6-epimerase [Candidatus Eremiobacteraeota bacterium]|uniref:ADP-L-glycero-D-mannoheptose-6-epimerase, NAD(P)-binding n=1 Tax=mine drainage metagenome TaxID=410659 RepID=E6PIR0_9ZZZZ|nr:ADP-glyceromanno-heptose 6-epimerase [Candidatus Eremiobacteraeota bacterium]